MEDIVKKIDYGKIRLNFYQINQGLLLCKYKEFNIYYMQYDDIYTIEKEKKRFKLYSRVTFNEMLKIVFK